MTIYGESWQVLILISALLTTPALADRQSYNAALAARAANRVAAATAKSGQRRKRLSKRSDYHKDRLTALAKQDRYSNQQWHTQLPGCTSSRQRSQAQQRAFERYDRRPVQ